MIRKCKPILSAIILAGSLLGPAALAQTAAPTAATPGSGMPMSGNSTSMPMMKSPADQDMMSGMTKMNQDMSNAPQTGNADKDFVAMMMPHHQGAIDMAETELKYGKDPAMRRLATDIVSAQKKEIAEMKAWQARHAAK